MMQAESGAAAPERASLTALAPAVLALLLSACGTLKGLEIGFPQAAQLQHGERIARNVCAACHDIGRETKARRAVAPAFVAISRKYSSSGLTLQMDAIAAIGHYSMPAIPLSAKEQRDLVAYIGTLRPAADEEVR